MNRTTLKIGGMSCGHCVMSVKKALEGMEGVKVESVSVGAASVEHEPAIATADDIVRAIGEVGYEAQVA
ncbi:MAG TPA: heavy-metal-associated domain-containing protein [Longimicrobiales bacterium]